MSTLTPVQLLRRVHDSFDAVGARDPSGVAADAVLHEIQLHGRIEAGLALETLPPTFLTANDVEPDLMLAAFSDAFGEAQLAVRLPLIVPPEEIDSFAKAAAVEPAAVSALKYPLPLAEDDIKRAILEILGEPFEQGHSGAELSDIFTPRLKLGGRQVTAAFMLKGRGLATVLRAKNAGDAGNQVTKLARTGATIFVVQHVHEIDLDVRAQLTHSISYLRSHGTPDAVGSVWDGAETARVLLAYDLLEIEGRTARFVTAKSDL